MSVFSVLIILNGCALTEAILITTGSYLLTGKSVSDNALSFATDMDCKSHNVFYGEAICNPHEEMYVKTENKDNQSLSLTANNGTESVISNLSPTNTPNSVKLTKTNQRQQSTANINENSDLVTTERLTPESLQQIINRKQSIEDQSLHSRKYSSRSSLNKEPKMYAVVGSFTDLSHAEFRQSLYHDFDALITQHNNDKSTIYRVIVGPLAQKKDVEEIPSQVDTERFNPWVISLCEDGHKLPPCNQSSINKELIAKLHKSNLKVSVND